ncbi:MAG: hypothetical protein ACO2O4_00240 [Minisyncoccia bacterium]|jgi:hypothetical protein
MLSIQDIKDLADKITSEFIATNSIPQIFIDTVYNFNENRFMKNILLGIILHSFKTDRYKKAFLRQLKKTNLYNKREIVVSYILASTNIENTKKYANEDQIVNVIYDVAEKMRKANLIPTNKNYLFLENIYLETILNRVDDLYEKYQSEKNKTNNKQSFYDFVRKEIATKVEKKKLLETNIVLDLKKGKVIIYSNDKQEKVSLEMSLEDFSNYLSKIVGFNVEYISFKKFSIILEKDKILGNAAFILI